MTLIIKLSSANGPVQEKCIVKEGIITNNKVVWKK